MPKGSAGSSTTSSTPSSDAMACTRLTMIGCGSSTGSRTRRTRNGCRRSHSSASPCGLVSTAKLSGGRRRQSSHR